MIKAVPFLLVFLFSLFSCTGEDTVTVSFKDTDIDPGLFVLPEGFALYNDAGDSTLDLVLSVYETVSSEAQRFVLSLEFLVPLKDPGDYRDSLSLQELRSEELPLIALSRWKYAGRSALVNGYSPADSEYPLKQWKHIVPEWNTETDPVRTERIEDALDAYLESKLRDSAPGLVWIAAVGDMMLQRGIEDVLIHQADGKERIFSDLLPHLTGFDLLMGNLEGAVTVRGSRTPKSYNFRFRPEVLEALKQTGFEYLSLTNNHCYDYGELGFLDTLGYLREYGISTSGAAESLRDALEPAVFSINGVKIRILSVGAFPRERNGFDGRTQAAVSSERPGILWYGKDALSAISSFSAEDGIDIVMVHGGHEWQRIPDPEQKIRYRSFIDAGADIVFGSHPHVLQGAEHYKGGIIYYSLGNFLFNGMEEMPYAEDSLVASLGIIDGKILYRRDLAVQIDGPNVRKDREGRILRQFRELSDGLSNP